MRCTSPNLGSSFWVEMTVLLLQVTGYAIYQCAGKVSAGWMHNQADGLIDDHHLVIFIYYVQRNIFRE